MTIEEGNKIIGVFMDTHLYCFIQGDTNMHRAKIHISEYDEYVKRGYTRFDLNYNTSFDNLMNVVEKIVKLNPKDGKEWYYYNMSHCHFRIYANTAFGISGEWKNNSGTTLGAMHKTVVEFIKWFNKQKL